jgi:HEAT repeat protein
MSNSQDELIAAIDKLRSDSVAVQNEGAQTALQAGKAALPHLLPLLQEQKAATRSQAMYVISRVGGSEASDVFKQGLQDQDERVRAYAAEGLALANDPDALSASLKTLNDAPDMAHLDMTPAVESLSEMGLDAVSPLLDLLMDDDEMTRLHAQRALEGIVNRMHGFQSGRGFPTPAAEQEMRNEWQSNGSYDYAAPVAARAAAVEKWRTWLEEKNK